MTKSLLTNVICFIAIVLSLVFNLALLFSAATFALSGALTNWLAIHLLFEKVPGLYGSGIIPKNFEPFKRSIKKLMMEQFFSQDNMNYLIEAQRHKLQTLNFEPILEKVDFNPVYASLLDVISQSSFGNMLQMAGGEKVLEPLKEPFIAKIKTTIIELSASDAVQQGLADQLASSSFLNQAQADIESMIDQRLAELTPELVKQMVQDIIKEHLGWLVIWGGVFGGILGVVWYCLPMVNLFS